MYLKSYVIGRSIEYIRFTWQKIYTRYSVQIPLSKLHIYFAANCTFILKLDFWAESMKTLQQWRIIQKVHSALAWGTRCLWHQLLKILYSRLCVFFKCPNSSSNAGFHCKTLRVRLRRSQYNSLFRRSRTTEWTDFSICQTADGFRRESLLQRR